MDAVDVLGTLPVGHGFSVQGKRYTIASLDGWRLNGRAVRVPARRADGSAVSLRVPRHASVVIG